MGRGRGGVVVVVGGPFTVCKQLNIFLFPHGTKW